MASCNEDCWNCPLEGCPNTLKISEKIDEDARIIKAIGGSRYKRYGATQKGHEVKRRAKLKYQQNNPEKVAVWSFKSRYKKKYGYPPTDKECKEWMESRYDKN